MTEQTVSFSLEKTIAHLIAEQVDKPKILYNVRSVRKRDDFGNPLDDKEYLSLEVFVTALKENYQLCRVIFDLSREYKFTIAYNDDDTKFIDPLNSAVNIAWKLDTQYEDRKCTYFVRLPSFGLMYQNGVFGLYNGYWFTSFPTTQKFAFDIFHHLAYSYLSMFKPKTLSADELLFDSFFGRRH